MDELKDSKICPNCGDQSDSGARFCASCGQKFTDARVRFTSIISTFLYSLFNADSSLWRSLKDIWIPGKLTTAYFSGRRKSYLHPARLFFFSWVLFFAIFSFSEGINIGPASDNLIENRKQDLDERQLIGSMLDFRDSLEISDTVDMTYIDHFLRYFATSKRENLKTGNLDSLRYLMDNRKDSFNVIVGVSGSRKIAWDDIVTMEDEELLEKYEITGFLGKLFSKQMLKMARETTSMTEYLVRGISWMVFILIPGMALVLYLMYFYRGFYYVEHLVFTLHCHTFFFVAMTAVWLLEKIINFYPETYGETWLSLDWIYMIVVFVSMIYPLIGLRTFYKSRIIGVIVKGYVAFNIYSVLAVISIILALMVRFMVF